MSVKREAGEQIGSFFRKLLTAAEEAKPGAGTFIGALRTGSRNEYIPGNPDQRILRDLADAADYNSPVENFREALKMATGRRPVLLQQDIGSSGYKDYIDYIGDNSSVTNELNLARVLGVAQTPDEIRVAKRAAARARALELFNKQPEEVRNTLVSMARISQLRPVSFLTARSLVKQPSDIREIAMALIADGVPAEEALRVARKL